MHQPVRSSGENTAEKYCEGPHSGAHKHDPASLTLRISVDCNRKEDVDEQPNDSNGDGPGTEEAEREQLKRC